MLETDGVLRMAASNYQQAESHLEGAELELRRLMQKLESCLTLMRNASGTEPVTRDEVEKLSQDEQPVSMDRMEMVGS
jgi:hypothetical protein